MSTQNLNVMRDSFTGQVTTLSDEDRPIFDEFIMDMLVALRPHTELEVFLAHDVAWDHWRLNRLRAIEMNIFALGVDNPALLVDGDDPRIDTAMADAATFLAESQKFAQLTDCEERLNRSLHRNLATLRELQAQRQATETQDLDEEILLARYSNIRGLPYQPSSPVSKNGFVFSNEKILAAANRLTTLAVAKIELEADPPKVQSAGVAAASNAANWSEKDAE